VGRVNNAIEVRSLVGKDTLVQTIPELQKTKFLVHADKGTIFAAATSELWCIRMVEIPIQRQQLLQQKKFQLAIELTVSPKNEIKIRRLPTTNFMFSKSPMNLPRTEPKPFARYTCSMRKSCLPIRSSRRP